MENTEKLYVLLVSDSSIAVPKMIYGPARHEVICDWLVNTAAMDLDADSFLRSKYLKNENTFAGMIRDAMNHKKIPCEWAIKPMDNAVRIMTSDGQSRIYAIAPAPVLSKEDAAYLANRLWPATLQWKNLS